MGAPVGNNNAAKSKPWSDAIRHAMAERERTGKPGALRDLAAVMIDKALEGDMAALKELGDRVEGKVPQGIIGGDESEPPVNLSVTFKGAANAPG